MAKTSVPRRTPPPEADDSPLKLQGMADVLRRLGDDATPEALYLLAGVCDDLAAQLGR